MPEIRKDIVSGRNVIFAGSRAFRPNDYRKKGGVCPFCPGNESETPPAVDEIREGGKWKVRVVPNKFPALSGDEPFPREIKDGIYRKVPGKGMHEVVVETPKHCVEIHNLPEKDLAGILKMYRRRVESMAGERHIKYVLVFKNKGRRAGASLSHPHSQIIGMPILPLRVMNEINGARRYRKENSSCPFCDMVAFESRVKKRVVSENAGFIAFNPYASRFLFETWILPKRHLSHFEKHPEKEFYLAARALRETLGKLERTLGKADYNLLFHSMPVREKENNFYHWHIEIMPKLSRMAGFEWGTGFYINIISPEKAADMLNSGKRFRC